MTGARRESRTDGPTAGVEHRHVEANGLTFHVAVGGPPDAPPVLCLHGFPEGWLSWEPVIEALPDARVYVPDLRGYPGTEPSKGGYDVVTLTDDIAALIEALGLNRPILVGHDWGGALAWIFAHRRSDRISRLVIVNCTHPKTLTRAILHCTDLQTFRVPWLYFFQLPWLPEHVLTTGLGRKALELSFTLREGTPGTMNVALVHELATRFQQPADFRDPIEYYRQIVRTYVLPRRRAALAATYSRPISVPVTMVWGEKDGALPAKVALGSDKDAGCPIEWRPLPGVGHFVSLEAPDKLAAEIRRVLDPGRRGGAGAPYPGS